MRSAYLSCHLFVSIPLITWPLLCSQLLLAGVHCFVPPVPVETILRNKIMNKPNSNGGNNGGSSWASMMAASSSSNANATSNTGVDLRSYVRGRPATNSTTTNRSKAPIYVPIGPPCAGKTTVLSHILAPKNATVASESKTHHPAAAGRTAGRDISIDDQEGVPFAEQAH